VSFVGVVVPIPFFRRLGKKSVPWISFSVFMGLAAAFTGVATGTYARSRQIDSDKKSKPVYAQPAGPLFVVISVSKQHLSVYGNNGLVSRAPVSTGMPGHSTPMGIFSILEKERFHRSNIYSGAPMPFMQRITWSGVAMHQGVLPGYPASHGCIRMPGEFARRLYGMTKGNERVIITRQDIAPVDFSHPRLPVPKMSPMPAAIDVASGPAQGLQTALAVNAVSQPAGGSEKVDVAVKPADAGAKLPAAERLVNPIEFARIMKTKAAADAVAAAAAVRPAQEEAVSKNREVKLANVELRKADIALENVKDRVESLESQIKRAKDEAAANTATAAKALAGEALKEVEARVAAARQAKEQKDGDAAVAMKTFRNAESASRAASDVVKTWNRRLEPLSVFISRKTSRLYVRQGHMKVFDVPVTISQPEKPLGTHLFMAMQPEQNAEQNAPVLRWLVLSIPDASTGSEDRSRRSGKRRSRYEEDAAPRIPVSASSAADALDRIQVSGDVAEKISEMIWSGSSVIVSDSGLSGETGDGTDFIILTR
jgi:lipoprotein-anchoring transpeptidase ErfK/SrfK